MGLALAVADSMDGTGGVVTVTGSDPATVNTVYRAQLLGAEGPLVWQAAGTRSGDGTLAVGGPARNYWLWYAQGTVGGAPAVSQVVQQSLTDATYLAVRTRGGLAIIDRLALLNLQDIPPERVYLRDSADDPVTTTPGVVVFRDPTPDQYLGGTNARDNVGYGWQVVFQDESRVGADSGPQMAKWDLWREKGERAFRNQRLPGLPESLITTVEPARASQPLGRAYQKMVTAFTVRIVAREVRGIQV